MPKPTIEWTSGPGGVARIIDQTRLPLEYVVLDVATPEAMFEAIASLRVRGAPAIGIAGAYGLVLAVGRRRFDTAAGFVAALDRAADYLKSSRPTAVNLAWAVDRAAAAARAAAAEGLSPAALNEVLLGAACAIDEEDRRVCRAIGQAGQDVLPDGARVLTHCNAGALATADYGTALAVVYRARELAKRVTVWADETRPLLQGSRLTAWELADAGIDVTVICDSAAASVMCAGKVDLVIVGADRIAANGDTANKIGTLGVAVFAKEFKIPFYVAAPVSTFDLSLATGAGIPIEERAAEEVTEGFGRRTAPPGACVYNPAFDVTPRRLITGIITEKGIIRRPGPRAIAALLGRARLHRRTPCD